MSVLAPDAPAIVVPASYKPTPLQIRQYMRAKLWKKVGYCPHPGQRGLHIAIDRGARYVYAEAGRRSGKSQAWATELLTEMAFEPMGLLPWRLCLIAAPESDVADNIFGLLYRWIVDMRVFGCGPLFRSTRGRYIEMPWHSKVEGKTTDEPASLRGPGLVMTVADEYAHGPDVLAEHLIAPLIDCAGILGVSTTPAGQNHAADTADDWRGQMLGSGQPGHPEYRAPNPVYYYGHWTSYDNVHLPEGAVAQIEEQYRRRGSLDIFGQEYLAQRASLRGAVYPQLDMKRHVKRPEHADGVPFGLGFDWGFDHPFVALLCQTIESDRVIVHDEVYARGMTDPEKVEATRAMLKRHGIGDMQLNSSFADPSSPQAIRTFRQSGIPMWDPEQGGVKGRLNAKLDGIALVRSLLGREDKPGLVIHERCTNLIRTLKGYHFKPEAKSEQPVKVDDDPPDALRYYCVGSLGGGRVVDWGVCV